MFFHHRLAQFLGIIVGILFTGYSLATFFLLPGWNTVTGVWDNDNFIDSSFWPLVSGPSQIAEAIYGVNASDITAYTQYFSGNHSCTTMNVEVLQPGLNTIPSTLSGNTIYVFSSGDYSVDDTVYGFDDCIALLGYGDVFLYGSSDPSSSNALVSLSGDFNVIDNISLDGLNDGSGGQHIPFMIGLSLFSQNSTIHATNVSHCGVNANNQGCFMLSGENIYGDTLGIYNTAGNGLSVQIDHSYITGVLADSIGGAAIALFNQLGGVRTNNTISSVIVDNAQFGLGGFAYSGLVIQDVAITNVSGGVIFADTPSSDLTLSNIDISTAGFGMFLGTGSQRFFINNTTISDAVTHGIEMYSGSFLSFENISLSQGSGDGIYMSGVKNSGFTGIVIEGFQGNGRTTENGAYNTFYDLTISSNGADGFSSSLSDYQNFHSLLIHNNSGNGLFASRDTNTQVSLGVFHDNAQGLNVSVLSGIIDHVKAYDNAIGVSLEGSNLHLIYSDFYNNDDGIFFPSLQTSRVYMVNVFNNDRGLVKDSTKLFSGVLLSNLEVFNNYLGAYINNSSSSTYHNIYFFNNGNGAGTGLQGAFGLSQSTRSVLSNLFFRNNDQGLIIGSGTTSINNTYYQTLLFEDNGSEYCYDTDDFYSLGTVSCDRTTLSDPGFLFPGSAGISGWQPGVVDIQTGVMTCHEAVNVEDHLGQDLLSYPYCDTVGRIDSWHSNQMIRYTYFQKVPRRQEYTAVVGGLQPVATGVTAATVFIGDIFYTNSHLITGGYAYGGAGFATGENDLYVSGDLIYKSTLDPVSLDLQVFRKSDYYIDGDIVTPVNGTIPIGHKLESIILTPGSGVHIVKTYFQINPTSNYYGLMRLMDDTPGELIFSKTLLTTNAVYPGSFVTYRLDYLYSGGTVLGDFDIIDQYQTGLQFVSATLPYVSTGYVSGNQAITWNFSGIAPGTSGFIDVVFQVDPTNTGGLLYNTGIITNSTTGIVSSEPVPVTYPIPNLLITKTLLTTGAIYPGDSVSYRLEYNYYSGILPGNFDVIDQYQSGFTFVSSTLPYTSTGYMSGNQTLVWSFSGVSPGTTGFIDVTLQIDLGVTGNVLFNTGIITNNTTTTTTYYTTTPVTSPICPGFVGDTAPDIFDLGSVSSALTGISYQSSGFVVVGIDTGALIVVSGGEYRIDSGVWTTATGLVYSGDFVEVRTIASSSYSTTVTATLTIGCVSDIFSVVTNSQPTPLGGGGGCTGSCGGGGPQPHDDCPLGDFSPSFFDGTCGNPEPDPNPDPVPVPTGDPYYNSPLHGSAEDEPIVSSDMVTLPIELPVTGPKR